MKKNNIKNFSNVTTSVTQGSWAMGSGGTWENRFCSALRTQTEEQSWSQPQIFLRGKTAFRRTQCLYETASKFFICKTLESLFIFPLRLLLLFPSSQNALLFKPLLVFSLKQLHLKYVH